MTETAGLRVEQMEQIAVSRVFASTPHETRVRRTADVGILGAGIVVLALAAWAAGNRTGPEMWAARTFADAPEWISDLCRVVYAAGGLWVLVIIAYLALRRSRLALLRDVLVAGGLAVVAAVLLAWVESSEWPEFFPEFGIDGDPAFPVLRLALASGVLLVALPSFTAPVRRTNRWVVVAMTLTALVLGYGAPTAIIGGLSIGVAAAAATRLMFGTSVGLPSLDRIRASLVDLGVACDHVDYDPVQPADRLLATASSPAGPLSVAVYGRDAAASMRAARVWRAMWYRDARSVLGVSREQQAEHAALALLLASRGGLGVPEVVAVGATTTGDALLVTQAPQGAALDQVAADDIDDALLDALWQQVTQLHAVDLSHGRIDPHGIALVDGTPTFTDLSQGRMSPVPVRNHVDLVEMLVTQSVVADPVRAVDAAVRNIDHDELVATLAVVQPAALSRDLTRAAKNAALDLDDLRAQLATALDTEPPELEQLRRVRVRDLVMLALLLVVANSIIGWLTNIDLDTFVDELRDASLAWLLIALVLSQFTNVFETLSMMGIVTRPLPWGPTLHFQYATSYIGLAVPSDAGRIAMTIRYLQKLGVPTRVAVGQGPFTTVFGYLIDFILLVVSAKVVGTDLELPDDTDLSGLVTLLVILVVLVVAGIVVVLAVPKFRHRIVPAIAETLRELKGSLTDPKRATMLIGGLFAKKLLFAMTLLTVATAFGYPISLATAVFINTAVSWFAGIIPVPGGIGVAEAGFTAGLMAFGVPQSAALAIAIAHRLLTTYLPPVVGYFSMRRLEHDGYI